MTTDTLINMAVLVVSLVAVAISLTIFRRSFRPIVTAAVKTHSGGSDSIAYNLVVLNSGTIPARNIRLRPADRARLDQALKSNATEGDRHRWLACFEATNDIDLLQNGTSVSCSFGMTGNTVDFWHYGARFPVAITYQGFFGQEYRTVVELRIADSDSFTGFRWGSPRAQ